MPSFIIVGSDTIDITVLTESYTYPAAPTKFPVEDQGNAIDHLIPGDLTIALSTLVTTTPFQVPSFGASDLLLRASLIVSRLRRAQLDGEFVVYDSAREGRTEDLVVTGITKPITVSNGVRIAIALAQLRVVIAETVAIPSAIIALSVRAKPKVPKGKKPLEAVTDEKKSAVQSTAFKLFG